MHYYTWFSKDYNNATMHLTIVEDMAFRRMLDWCYREEKQLPKNISEICKLIRYTKRQSKVVKAILDEFFIETEDGFINKKVSEELSRFQKKSEKAKKSAQQRWHKSSKTKASANANALQTHCEGNANQQPTTNNYINNNVEDSNESPTSKSESEQDLNLANQMYEAIKQDLPKLKKPNFQKWARDIRLMRDRDERTNAQIEDMFVWTREDSFWSTNILSPSSLRKQFDRLTAQRSKTHENNNRPNQTKLPTVERSRQAAINYAKEHGLFDDEQSPTQSNDYILGDNVEYIRR